MFWFKRMPDAVLRRYKATDGSFLYNDLVRTYRVNGKLWCDFRGVVLLLRDDGTVLGDPDVHEWEEL